MKKLNIFTVLFRYIFVFISLVAVSSVYAHESDSQDLSKKLHCPAAREYVTTLQFLRARSESKDLADGEKQKISEQVAHGCSGSAQRFSRVFNLLEKVELTLNDVMATSIELSQKSDADVETFVLVFQKSFLQEYLDLDLNTSLTWARSFAKDFGAESPKAREDFTKLVEFCVRAKSLDLPKPQCGEFAKRLTKSGEKYGFGVFPIFKDAFEFMTQDNSGPHLTTGDGLKFAEELVKAGPDSSENFRLAYLYAVSTSGLNVDRDEAVKIAHRLALITVADTTNNKSESESIKK